jgi:hypothetical protein
MDMFECGGWVDIWATPEESDCFVRIRHLDCHQKYVCIDVPEDIKKFIAENTKLRAPQVCISAFFLLGKLLISRKALEGDTQDLPASEFYAESSLQLLVQTTASELATLR